MPSPLSWVFGQGFASSNWDRGGVTPPIAVPPTVLCGSWESPLSQPPSPQLFLSYALSLRSHDLLYVLARILLSRGFPILSAECFDTEAWQREHQ